MSITNLKISVFQFAMILVLSGPISIYLYTAKSNLIKIEYQLTAGFVYPQYTCTGDSTNKLYLLDSDALNTNKSILQKFVNDEEIEYKVRFIRNTYHGLYKYEIVTHKSNYNSTIKNIEDANNQIIKLEKSLIAEVFENIKIKCGNGNYEPLFRPGLSGKDIFITQKNRYSNKALFFITSAPLLLIYLFFIISNYLKKNNLNNI
jgi:hypothetical protein